MNRERLEQQYFELGNELPQIYPQLNFKNHCYWRISLDHVVGNKWNQWIEKPAYKNLTDDQLLATIDLMKRYSRDVNLLRQHNKESLEYRQNK